MYAINAAIHGAALHSTALHGAAWQGAASHIVASHSTASHVVARHNIEPRGTAQHCTAWALLFKTRIGRVGRGRIQRPTHLDFSELDPIWINGPSLADMSLFGPVFFLISVCVQT